MHRICTVLTRYGGKRLTVLNYREIAAVGIGTDDVELNISVNDLGLCLLRIIVRYKTEHRHTYRLRVGYLRVLVRIILAVELTAHGKRGFKVLKANECTASVREEGVAVKILRCGTEIRKYLYRIKREGPLVEADTVCGKSYLESVLVEIVLKRETEKCGIAVGRGILDLIVALCEHLVCEVGAVELYVALDDVHLTLGGIRLELINSHILCNRNTCVHLVYLCLTLALGILKRVECIQILDEILTVTGLLTLAVYKDHGLELRLFDKAREQSTCLKTTHRVLYADTVLYVLDINLSASGSLGVGIHRACFAVLGIGEYYLREQHTLYVGGSAASALCNAVRVCKRYRARLGVAIGDLAGRRLEIQLIAVKLEHEIHRRKLILLRRKIMVKIVYCLCFARCCGGRCRICRVGADGGRRKHRKQCKSKTDYSEFFHLSFLLFALCLCPEG